MTQNNTTFKDFVITELDSRTGMRQLRGEFLVCRAKKDTEGNLSLKLNLPESIRRQMLQAVKQGQFVRFFAPER